MTTVNWEREPGEKVEEFVAAMLLLEHPQGNRITPSRGDRGVDIRVGHPDGYDIYQVKRYSRPLTRQQAREVEESWDRFVDQTLPTLPVRSWTLVTPWNPSNERLDWLHQLTAGSGLRIHWMGGSTLDAMAAERPSLVDYFFGDGGQRLQRLLADVLRGGRDVPQGAAGQDLLDAVVARYGALARALNEVDPFYRYEVAIRSGQVGEQRWDADLPDAAAAFVRYQQLDDEHFLVVRLVPLSAESARMRPITTSVEVQVPVGSPQHQAIEDFLTYGVPFEGISATVTGGSGPPGIADVSGPGWLRYMVMPHSGDHRPDLEVRLISDDGEVLHTVDLVDSRISQGFQGPGVWVSATDRSGALELEFLVNAGDRDTIRMSLGPLAGKTPADLLPTVRMLAAFTDQTTVRLAVRAGKAYPPRWSTQETALTTYARQHVAVLEALQTIQHHTYERIVMPDLDAASADDVHQILWLGRLLREERIETTWTRAQWTGQTPHPLTHTDGEFPLMFTRQLSVDLNGRQIPLDVSKRVLYYSARIADQAEETTATADTTLVFVPGSTDRALITVVPAA